MDSTLLYALIAVYALATGLLISYMQIKKIKQGRKSNIQFLLIVLSLPLLLILVTNDSCTDFYSYVKIYDRSSFSTLGTFDEEFGWVILNSLLKTITDDGIIGVNILRGITFCVFLKGLINARDYIDIGWAWIAFVCICYFNIFSMVAFMLAVAFVFLASVNYVKRKFIWGSIEILIAISFHYTAIIPAFIPAAYYICFKSAYTRKVFISIMLIGMLIVTLMSSEIFTLATTLVPFLSRYAVYGLSTQEGTGLRQFVNYLPVLLCLPFIKLGAGNRLMNLSFVTTLFGITVGFASYSINNLLRTYLYFSLIFVYFFPALILMKESHGGSIYSSSISVPRSEKVPLTSRTFKMLVLFYLLYRMYYLLSSEWETAISSGFSDFHFLF